MRRSHRSDDSLAGVAVFKVVILYVVAMGVLLLCDFVVASLRRSRAAGSRLGPVNR